MLLLAWRGHHGGWHELGHMGCSTATGCCRDGGHNSPVQGSLPHPLLLQSTPGSHNWGRALVPRLGSNLGLSSSMYRYKPALPILAERLRV